MLIALAGLLVGLVALLAIPVDVVFAVQRDEGFRGSLTIHWLFGAVRIPVRSARGHAKGGKAKGSPAPRRPRHGRRAWAMLRSEGFVSRLLRLLRSLVTRVRIRHLSLYLRLGLDDPADTGQLWGMLGPLAWAIPLPAGAVVAIEPEFTGAAFRVEGEGAVRIVPIEILATLIAFALSPATWRAAGMPATGR